MPNTIRVPISNIPMDGDYTGMIYVGSQKKPANVLLDTGSSTLALDGNHYDPTKDSDAKLTNMAQEVGYADRSSWVGGLVLTDIALGHGSQMISLPKVHTAVSYHATKNMFGNADGILGLAYTRLNNVFIMPDVTLPPHFTYNQIQEGKVAYVKPYFTQLEEAGVVANKFAFYTLRSMVSHARDDLASDPLNNGYMILGGGEENTDLYTGTFQSARVVHDDFYNTNLKAVIVGNSDPIEVPPPTKNSGNASNSIVDSGTQALVIDQKLFNAILVRFSHDKPEHAHAIRIGEVAMTSLNLANWPTLTFVMEGDAGNDIRLALTPDTYWQLNAPESGRASAMIEGDGGSGQGQSILGLPLINNYFTIFDRAVDQGLGAVKFAPIKR